MKKIDVLGFICLSLFMLCCSSLDESYRGYLLYENKPLIRAKVLEDGTDNYTYTDKEGYFTLKRDHPNFISDLIIQVNGTFVMDTIGLAVKSGSDSRLYFLFLEKKNDSLDIHTSRFFKEQSRNSKFNYEYYFGYILYNMKPVFNAKITDETADIQTYTRKNGFFYLKRTDLNFIDKLIIKEDGSTKKDTIELLRKGSDGKPYSLFFRNEKDTIAYQNKLDLYEERKAK